MLSYLKTITLSLFCVGALYLYAMQQEDLGMGIYSEVHLNGGGESSEESPYDKLGIYDESRIYAGKSSGTSSPQEESDDSDVAAHSPELAEKIRKSRADSIDVKNVDVLELSGGAILQIPKQLHQRLDQLNVELQQKLLPKVGLSDFKKAEALIRAGADPNSLTQNGYPLIVEAMHKNRFDVVEFLQKNGANLDKKAKDGTTALHQAVKSGIVRTVRFLLMNGANPNIVDTNDTAPLMLTVFVQNRNNAIQIARLLLNAGADITARNKQGENAITFAKMFRNREDLIAYLERKWREREVAERRAREAILKKQKEAEEAEAESHLIY